MKSGWDMAQRGLALPQRALRNSPSLGYLPEHLAMSFCFGLLGLPHEYLLYVGLDGHTTSAGLGSQLVRNVDGNLHGTILARTISMLGNPAGDGGLTKFVLTECPVWLTMKDRFQRVCHGVDAEVLRGVRNWIRRAPRR